MPTQTKIERTGKPTICIDGQLEIDQERGVIYFHAQAGYTALRICSLPKPIPDKRWVIRNGEVKKQGDMLDITHMYGCNWREY